MTSHPHSAATRGNGASLVRAVALAFLGAVFIAICARIQIPMWPVPMTMQSFAVLLVGLTYGFRLGTATLLLYLAQGAVGVPVFAAGGGLAYMMGPTAGYLIGFVLAAATMGYLADRGIADRWPGLLGAVALGTLLIFAPGVLWLSTSMGLAAAWGAGAAPFLLGALVKGALAALLAKPAVRALRQI